MNRISEQIGNSLGLLRALEAISNRKAFLSLLAGAVVGTVLFSVAIAMGSKLAFSGNAGIGSVIGFLGGLTGILVMLAGFSATGIHLTLHFRNSSGLSLMEGFMAALLTLPKFIAVFILLGLIYLGVTLVILLVFLLCKIPVLGPLLYVIALPVSALIMGMLAYAAVFMAPLVGPAIWSGERVLGAIAMLWAILRQRLLAVIIKALLLGILTGIVGGLVMGAVAFGLFNAGLLSAAVIGVIGNDPMGMLGMLGMLSQGEVHGSGHMVAGAIGSIVLIASASVLPLLVVIGGNCIIYIEVADGLSTGEIEGQVLNKYRDAKAKAMETAARLKEAGDSARDKLNQGGNPDASSPRASASAECPKCHGPAGSDDVFCGNCGNRLK